MARLLGIPDWLDRSNKAARILKLSDLASEVMCVDASHVVDAHQPYEN